MKKRILAILLSLSLVFSISFLSAGCGSNKKKGEILIWWPGSAMESIELAAEQYKAQNPDVSFKIVPRQQTNFFMEYMVERQGKNYPDVVFVDSVYVSQLASRNFITNLSEYDNEIETSVKAKVVDSFWATNAYKEKIYGLPISANVLSLVYNKAILKTVYQDMLERAWSETDVPSTWEELTTICELINQYNKKHSLSEINSYIPYTIPLGDPGSAPNVRSMSSMYFVSMCAREGGSIMNSDFSQPTLNTEQNRAAAQKIADLGANKHISRYYEENRFEAGRVAFIEMGSWKISQYEHITASKGVEHFEAGYAPMLRLREGGNRASGLGMYSVVSSSGSINEEIAVDFMKFFLANDEAMLLHNKSLDLLPVTKSTSEDEYFKTGSAWAVYQKQMEDVVLRPATPYWSLMEQDFAMFVERLTTGDRTPAQLSGLQFAVAEKMGLA